MRRTAATTAAALLLSLVPAAAPAFNEESFVVTQLTANGERESHAAVSGDRVVWQGTGGADGGSDFEIFMWTPSRGTAQLTQNETEDLSPVVSGPRVAWLGTAETGDRLNTEVFTWTPDGGTVRITTDGVDQAGLCGAMDRLAWVAAGGGDGGGDVEVFTWTSAGGVRQMTSDSSDNAVRLSGDRLAWTTDGVVVTWTPSDPAGGLTLGSGASELAVSDDRCTWITDGGAIQTWTPTEGVLPVNNTLNRGTYNLRACGDRIVWHTTYQTSPRFSEHGVCSWTPGEGQAWVCQEVKQAAAGVAENRVVFWAGGTSLATWTPEKGYSNVQDSYQVYGGEEPAVSGDRMVWTDTRGTDVGDDLEVFTAVPEGYSPPPPDEPGSLPYTVPVHRLFSTRTGAHLLTIDDAEKAAAEARGYRYEGVGLHAFDTPAQDLLPVHRFYCPRTGDHFYTASPEEVAEVIAKLGYEYAYEGVSFYVNANATASVVHRHYDAPRGLHLYAAYPDTVPPPQSLWETGYQYEGVAFYAVP